MESTEMIVEQQRATLTIALLAAFTDGVKDDREREQIGQSAEMLGDAADPINLAGWYQDSLLCGRGEFRGRVVLADSADAIPAPMRLASNSI
jgi:hypothetical protein